MGKRDSLFSTCVLSRYRANSVIYDQGVIFEEFSIYVMRYEILNKQVGICNLSKKKNQVQG